MSCEHCVNRREFLARSGLAAATVLATACGDGQIGPLTAPLTGVTKTIKVGDHPGLATTNQVVVVDQEFAVKRTGPTSFTAMSMFCTHAGCLTDLTGAQFFCPCHGSRFDLNGRVVSGPADRPHPTFTATYDPATDILTLRG